MKRLINEIRFEHEDKPYRFELSYHDNLFQSGPIRREFVHIDVGDVRLGVLEKAVELALVKMGEHHARKRALGTAPTRKDLWFETGTFGARIGVRMEFTR